MPHGRMQRIAALPRDKTYEAYTANLTIFTLKKNFLLTIFQVIKTVELTLKNRTSELLIFFYLTR